MDKRKLIMILAVVIGIPLFIWIQFFEVPNKVKVAEEKMQQDPETHDFNQVVNYENDYMGDAPNISELFQALPLNNHRGSLEMDSDAFLLTINYNVTTDELGNKGKQAVIYNTTAAFTLIRNLQKVDMRFEDKSYIVTRDNVEKWFGNNLIDLKNPEDFKEKVQEQLSKENIDDWITAYTE